MRFKKRQKPRKVEKANESQNGRVFLRYFFGLAVLVGLVVVKTQMTEETVVAESSQAVDVQIRTSVPESKTLGPTATPPTEPVVKAPDVETPEPTPDTVHTLAPTTSPVEPQPPQASTYFTDVLKKLDEARQTWIENTLIPEYGKENYENIFYDGEQLLSFKPVSEKGTSTERLRSKLKIKLLESSMKGSSKYVWATGGHSAAAAHGNLYNESYTAVLERDLKQVFPAVGLEIEARNYAMGGQGSGPEIFLCVEQIFGTDIDSLSWDFGMTDVYSPYRLFLYALRTNLLKNHPALFSIRSSSEGRLDLLKQAEEMGMTAFHLPDEVIQAQKEAIPDVTVDNAQDIDKMPPMVRAFKCDGQIENGDLGCLDNKYSKGVCDARTGKASWHPGFKSHALDGHTMALFMVQELRTSVEELATILEDYEPEDNHRKGRVLRGLFPNENIDSRKLGTQDLLEKLQNEEKDLFRKFQEAPLPEKALKIHRWRKCEENTTNEAEVAQKETECGQDPEFEDLIPILYKGPGLCHTSLLPSETRYKGYLGDDTSKTGGPVPYGQETYQVGISLSEADKESNPTVRLVTPNADKSQVDCPAVVSPDYKDFFYIHQRDGESSIKVPNSAEKEAYSYSAEKFQGMIAINFIKCPWGKCPRGYLGSNKYYQEGKYEIKINGESVVSLIPFHEPGCYFLKGANGVKWKPNADTSDFDFTFLVKEKDSYIELSSIILF